MRCYIKNKLAWMIALFNASCCITPWASLISIYISACLLIHPVHTDYVAPEYDIMARSPPSSFFQT